MLKTLFQLQLLSFSKEPPPTSLTLIRTIPHSGYSEGLDYHKAFLWHTTDKLILKIDPKDGTVVARFAPPTSHCESLKWINEKLFHVSFETNGIYQGVPKSNQINLKKIASKSFKR